MWDLMIDGLLFTALFWAVTFTVTIVRAGLDLRRESKQLEHVAVYMTEAQQKEAKR